MTSITEIGSPTNTFNNLLFICCIYGLIFIKCSANSVLGETRFNVGLGGLYTYILQWIIIHCIRPEDITIQ